MLFSPSTVWAVSNLSITYSIDGHNPDSYGPEVFTTGEYQYIYEVSFISDESEIDPTSIEYEIDTNGRESLASNVTYDGGTTVDIRMLLDQVIYADGDAHTITFYAKTDALEEVSDTQALQPTPDTTAPDLYFDTFTEGTIAVMDAPFVFTVSDYQLTDISADVDGIPYAITPYDSNFDYANYDINLATDTPPVDVFDGDPHTFHYTVSDPYGNVSQRSYTFTYSVDTTPPVLNFTTSQTGAATLPILFEGTADEAESNMGSVKYAVDGGARLDPDIDFGSSTPQHTAFSYDFSALSEGTHTIVFYATDSELNESSQSFTIDVPEPDVTGPVFTFTQSYTGLSPATLIYEGTVEDAASTMYSIQYSVDGGGREDVPVDFDNSTAYLFDFGIDLSGLSAGAHEIIFYAADSLANETSQSFTIDHDTVLPSCTASWTNLDIPHYSEVLDYPNVTCTDDREIVDAQYGAYHVVWGDLHLYADHHVLPEDGVNDEASETYDLHIDLTEFVDIDGVVLAQFKVTDEAGNQSYDYDPVTIDATDNTDPTVNLDQVTPDPLTDTTPTITGSCRDNANLETNTFISDISYKVDADAYTTVTLPDAGVYNDSATESFSVDLPALASGAHTVTVSCTDGASHTVTASDSFTIQDPIDPVPGEFTYVEDFDNTTSQDIPNSNNMVWGNGQLRLKEDITTSRTLINSTGACDRYGDCRGLWEVWQDPVDSNILWYYLGTKIYYYNTVTQANTWFDYETEYGITPMGGALNGFALGVYGGKKYLWFSDIYSLSIVNLTDHTSINNLNYPEVGAITLDFSRNRLAAYVLTTASGPNSNLAYLNLNGTMDQGDDVFTPIPLSTLNSTAFLGFLVDPVSNAVYSGAYSNTLFKWDDHNNPADYASYTVTSYGAGVYDSVFGGMALDPDRRLIFGTANNANPRLYVISDDGGTPFDASDDTVTQLASPQQLGYKNIYGIQYVAGENGVGDQLILKTETDNPIYVNFNSTYTNTSDDTFIDLESRAGIRPGAVAPYLKDYNTMYVLVKNQGFYKVDLTRGWENTGDAVALPTRPPQQLVVDNFVAEANVGGPIAYLPESSNSMMSKIGRAIVPLAQAADSGIHYYVSTDGGVTWSEVTLGELQQLQQIDYRVKFKISMNEVDGASPVLNSYSLAYAGYPTPSDQSTTTGLSVSPSTTTLTTATTMSVTVEAVDVLGFKTPGYNGTATLSLIDTTTGLTTSGLNVSSVNLTSGTGSLSGVQINKTGTFKIHATDGSFTQESGVITVTSGAVLNSPSLGFSASSFKVKKGETVTLHWASSYLTSFILNPGDNHLSATTGDFYVHPTETTTYTITGSGPYGSASSSLTVTVEGELSADASPSPSASPSASVSPSASPGSDETAGFIITTSDDQTIVRGQKAGLSWDIPDADEVTIDYPELHVVSSKGSFDFFPTDTTVVTITARKGDEVVQKKVTITVLNVPAQVQEFARNLQDKLPWTTPLLSGALQATKAVPGIGLGLAAVIQTGVVGLLVTSVVSQVGLLAAFNGKTFLNILSAAGVLPQKQRKGFVHQARNGAPIPFASISVYEGLNQRMAPIVTLVSDMYGVYLEPFLPKGEYSLVAAHSTHDFPTKLQRPAHLSFKDFYKGEVLGVVSNKEHPALLIPMDAKTAEASKHKLRYRLLLGLNRLLYMLQWTVYPLSVISVVSLWLSPNIFNAAIVVLYALIMLPKLLLLLKRPVLQGRVVMEGDRRPVPNATITLTTNDGSAVAVSKSDAQGNFEFFAPKGNYVMNVVSASLLWKDAKAGTLYTVQANGNFTKPLTLSMSKIENPFGGFTAAPVSK